MDTKSKIRIRLISRLRSLSDENLKEVEDFLSRISGEAERKENVLQLAGSWDGLADDVVRSLTSELHQRRLNDRNRFDL